MILRLRRAFRFDDNPALLAAWEEVDRDWRRISVYLEKQTLGPHAERFRSVGRCEFSDRLGSLGVQVLLNPPEGSEPAVLAGGLQKEADTLFDHLPVESARSLRSFTDFRKAIRGRPVSPWVSPHPIDSPLPFPRRDPLSDSRSAFPFLGGESDALAHLRSYFSVPERVHAYKKTRNGMLGVDYSSKLSPFLASGVLSVRRVWSEIEIFEQKFGSSEGSEWLKFELLWREYFRWLAAEQGEAFFSERGARDVDPLPAHADEGLYRRWTRAETGDAFVDANLRELIVTGFMSNRGRQNVASHLIHELRLPWQWGERFFSQMLIDSDPIQNFGNWAYLAGVGADPRSFGGKPRKFDLVRQAETYDPDGSYRSTWGA